MSNTYMKIGIIADTHGSLSEASLTVLKDSDHILHAGDIGTPSVLYELESIAPVTAIRGNCDHTDFGYGVDIRMAKELGGLTFAMVHEPQYLEDMKADIYVHGHTHMPKIEHKDGHLLVCPGSASNPRGGSHSSVAMVTISEGAVLESEILEV